MCRLRQYLYTPLGDTMQRKTEWCFIPDGTVSRHSCVYWSHENPLVTEEQAVDLPGVSVWCGPSSNVMTGPFFFEVSVTGTSYLQIPQDIISCMRSLLSDETYFQRFPGRWIEWRGSVHCPPGSPDLTPLDFNLWGDLKNTAYARKPRTLQGLRHEIEIACAAIPPAAIRKYVTLLQYVVNSSFGPVVDTLKVCE
jgi:hypothetical protein